MLVGALETIYASLKFIFFSFVTIKVAGDIV